MLDVHCHLDRYKDPNKVAAESATRGVFTIAVTNLPSHFRIGLPHARKLAKVRLALGLHPLAAAEHGRELSLFRESINLTSFVGEVGLDFSRDGKDTRAIQLESFRLVAKLVSTGSKVVSLHSRGAESTVLDILTEYKVPIAIFHWYSGPMSVLDEAVSKGHLFSVNPAMVCSEKGKQIIARIPPGQLLTETDGPYTKIGRIPTCPWDVLQVEKHLSQVWAVNSEEVRTRVWCNFKEMLSRLHLVNVSQE
jgi:TatD DNase family protein